MKQFTNHYQKISSIDPWFLEQIFNLVEIEKEMSHKKIKDISPEELLFYKKKWGCSEYSHYNLVKIQKKYHFKIYKLLATLFRHYNDFKGRKNKKIITKHDYEQ